MSGNTAAWLQQLQSAKSTAMVQDGEPSRRLWRCVAIFREHGVWDPHNSINKTAHPFRPPLPAAILGSAGRVKSHFTFDDGREMVEEHEVSSGVLAGTNKTGFCFASAALSAAVARQWVRCWPLTVGHRPSRTARKWRKTGVLGGAGTWTYEVGEAPRASSGEDGLTIASSNVGKTSRHHSGKGQRQGTVECF